MTLLTAHVGSLAKSFDDIQSALVSVKWILGDSLGSHLLSEDHMHQAHCKQQTSDKAEHDPTWPGKIRFCHAIM